MMKGAIQVSIGFLIVMVISALVMIFMMSWLGNLFPQLNQISEYATAQAERQMMDEFAKGGDTILATIPYKTKFSPGSEINYKIGVRKTATVDESQYFAICVGKVGGVTCVTPAEETPIAVEVCEEDGDGDPIRGACSIEFKFPTVTKIDERGDTKLMSAIMTIPRDINPGIYGFRIYVCANRPYDENIDIPDGEMVDGVRIYNDVDDNGNLLMIDDGDDQVLPGDEDAVAVWFKCEGLADSYGQFDFIAQVA